MKIKFTHPVPDKGYQAGLEYDVPLAEAQNYLEADIAIRVDEVPERPAPNVTRSQKEKMVKHDDG